MKNFIGKISNLIGLIGLTIVYGFSIIIFFLGFAFKVNIAGNYYDFLENPGEIYYVVPLVMFIIGAIISLGVIVFDLIYLIRNRSGKFPFFLSLILLSYLIIVVSVTFYLRVYVQGMEMEGMNLVTFIICGSLSVFFSLLITSGNLLNYHINK